jgi:hypothetical protein
MRTSLNEIKQIEAYLHHTLPAEERLVMEARLITDEDLRLKLYLQRKVYALIALYKRRKLKAEVEGLHNRLFSDPAKTSFKQNILNYFKS